MIDAKDLIAALDAAIQTAVVMLPEQVSETRRAVLAELDRQGWACVPKEPTPMMACEGRTAQAVGANGYASPQVIWAAMIAAAPEPPK